ncbi:type III secretion protein R [Variovorax sp. OK605]|jgi:type III secretion protein R|uniref:type III secretion system export apparatus subunit SctR n=1 Tax=unclassified Variovorax TaxID=663243 RepID=UPI0008C89166|nr:MULTISPECIES: type III secretion system export apparatus subunit SctR [unclassified Variovorax]SEK10074.1 type III secretion protein R [Variovorax sp. OK202]SFD66197.1 type III secretion protein R [Variovorax sp. OK212]SFQ12943.1 type III secretion protein R [Variovorax sp. OK605]
MGNFDPITLAFLLALMALLPTVVVVTTSFLKIAVVMSLLRNALGVQQMPPNIALYGMALILSAYIMAPVGAHMYDRLATSPEALRSVPALVSSVREGAEPLREFMVRNSKPAQRDFFVSTAQKMWGPVLAADVTQRDFLVLMPAFVVSELTSAFQIGFLLYLPFVVIDLIVSNILLAMGMMMVSPVTISLPLKLFLFVMVDGWSRLIQGLILTYA